MMQKKGKKKKTDKEEDKEDELKVQNDQTEQSQADVNDSIQVSRL